MREQLKKDLPLIQNLFKFAMETLSQLTEPTPIPAMQPLPPLPQHRPLPSRTGKGNA